MRKILLAALLLLATPVLAEQPATLTCYFQSGEHFTVVGSGGTSMIQWDAKGFRSAASAFEDPWLTVVELSDTGNRFKMAFNVRTKEAYGETTFSDGHKSGGPLWCVFK
jgi:hypothetical protein